MLTPIFLIMRGVFKLARRMKKSRIDVLRDDLQFMVQEDGDSVIFQWKEITGGVWNETYEVWEGGTEEEKTYTIRGIGKIVDYAEDEMEYEYGRVGVGECVVRFAWNADLSPIMGKEGVRFMYRNQRWKIDSPLGLGDTYNDNLYSLAIRGVKSSD